MPIKLFQISIALPTPRPRIGPRIRNSFGIGHISYWFSDWMIGLFKMFTIMSIWIFQGWAKNPTTDCTKPQVAFYLANLALASLSRINFHYTSMWAIFFSDFLIFHLSDGSNMSFNTRGDSEKLSINIPGKLQKISLAPK